MPNHERPGRSDPAGPTQPIRPQQGSEPIPERIRQPIVVPRPESTIAGLPRPLVVAAAVALLVALGGGFLIGRAVGGEGDAAGEDPTAAGRGACRKALSLSIQVVELQKQALANRSEAAQALALQEEGRVGDLNADLEPLAAALQQAEGELAGAVERCQSAEGRGGRGDRRRGNRAGNPDGDR